MSDRGIQCAVIYARLGLSAKDIAQFLDANRFRWNWAQITEIRNQG